MWPLQVSAAWEEGQLQVCKPPHPSASIAKYGASRTALTVFAMLCRLSDERFTERFISD